MNDDDLIRYSRHILLPEIEYEGQEKICNSHALIMVAVAQLVESRIVIPVVVGSPHQPPQLIA